APVPSAVPRVPQLRRSWARRDAADLQNAMTGWHHVGMTSPKQGLGSQSRFALMAKLVRPEDFEGRMLITSDLDAHHREIQKFVDMGFGRGYLHNVGRNQQE